MPAQISFNATEFYDWMEKINQLLEHTDGVFNLYNPAYDKEEVMGFLWNDEILPISLHLKEA